MKQYTTPWGVFVLGENSQKAEQLFERGEFHQDEIAVIKAHTNPQSVVVDVGANVGAIAVPVAGFVKEVHAFEPVLSNVANLHENITRNKLGKVIVHTCALGKEFGSARMEADGGDVRTYAVRDGSGVDVVPLDSFDLSPDFIKIDVEGYELEVLQGARETLKRSSPAIHFEVNLMCLRARGDWWLREVSKELHSQGYSLFYKDKPVRSVAWLMFKQAPKAFLLGGMYYNINLLAKK